jgi:hypothetical protein
MYGRYLNSARDGGELSHSRPGSFMPMRIARNTHRLKDYVGPIVGMDIVQGRKYVSNPYSSGIQPLS